MDDVQQVEREIPAWRRWVVSLAAVGLLIVVVAMQRPGPADPAARAREWSGLNVEPPRASPYILMGKLLLGFKADWGAEFASMMRLQFDQMSQRNSRGESVGDLSPTDELRVAMVLVGAGQADEPPPAPASPFMLGTSAAGERPTIRSRLEWVEATVDPASPLIEDVRAVRAVLEAGESDEGGDDPLGVLSEEQRQGLRTRHGWFAEAFLAAGDAQAEVVQRAGAATSLFIIGAALVGGFLVCAAFAGLVLLIVGIVLAAKGKLVRRFEKPPLEERPRWAEMVWLEAFAVFVGGFLALKLAQSAAAAYFPNARWLMTASLVGQWVLAASIFWPVVRGLSWAEWKRRVGWTPAPAPAGRLPGGRPERPSVAREIGYGFITYLCALPLMFGTVIVVMIISVIIEMITGESPVSARQVNKVEEMLGGAGPLELALMATLVTIWAPIVEETIFRGSLYRHLRRGLPVLAAGAISALVFALMHQYMVLQLFVVFVLGMVFAMAREWRGSLIPSATAHAIQNTFALCMMLLLSGLMRG